MTNNQVMIDIETLSTRPNAVILTIGAVKFDPFSLQEPGPGFYCRVEIDSQDRHVCEDTMSWWAQQNPQVQQEAFNEHDRLPLAQALQDLSRFCDSQQGYWSHGVVFDMGILEDAYVSLGLRAWIPWSYTLVRDCRTVLKISSTPVERGDQAHNALVDCWYQALAVQRACEKMGLHDKTGVANH